MRRTAPWLLGLALVVVASIAALVAGAIGTSLSDVARATAEAMGLLPPGSSPPEHVSVVATIRAPRVATGVLVGAGLGVAGAAMQGMFRNPLADPALLGVSLGASLGAATVLILVDQIASTWWLPGAAFAGGLFATMVAMAAGRRRGFVDIASLLLAGVAVQAFCGAVIGLLIFGASDAKQRDLTFWLLGSLGGATWSRWLASAPPLIAAIAVLPLFGPALDALALGDAEAADLGVRVSHVRWGVVVLVALGVGAAVAVAGPIGFIGLVVPHLARRLGCVAYRVLIPASALGGAALLVSADAAARTIAKPTELPIGVVTAFIGAPFFYVLLVRRRGGEGEAG